MKKTFRRFTLVEMLTVVAIIGILAGLIIPTVVIAQRRGRETQAKSDISGIMTALKQLKSDYNRILLKNGVINGSTAAAPSNDISTINGTTYETLIAELSVPKNAGLTQTASTRINKRKKVYLDPKNGFDPTINYNAGTNAEKLWLDPWGGGYVIYINTSGTQAIQLPGTQKDPDHTDTPKTIATDIAVYSVGPNGEDDKGCNSTLEDCIKKNDDENHKNHDDIASWNL